MFSFKSFLFVLFLLLFIFQSCECTEGYAYCSGCLTGCCYWVFDTSQTNDPNCTTSSYCECFPLNTCVLYGTNTNYPAGDRQCSYSACSSQCCHYSIDSTIQDFECKLTATCKCTNYSACSNTNNAYTCIDYFNNYTQSSHGAENYYDSWWYADCLSQYSGHTYVAVSYSVWKAVVAVGSVLDGLLVILIAYLIYYKCYQKPKNYNNAMGGLNKN